MGKFPLKVKIVTHLLTHMLSQTCMTFSFLPWNNKEEFFIKYQWFYVYTVKVNGVQNCERFINPVAF